MADVNDYLPGGKLDPNQVEVIEGEINLAGEQHQERQTTPVVSTPEVVDWEERFKNLEQHNSRQAQDLGLYRKMVDDYIVSPTSTTPVVEQESQPITVDDLYDNPDEAIQRAVESHPAIQEARELKADMDRQKQQNHYDSFLSRHPDAHAIGGDPKFAQWVEADPMRIELFQRGNQYDLSAADALFRLYKAENNISQMTAEQEQAQNIAAANLEESSALMVNEAPKYSRSEYVDKLMRARQGDLDAERWVQRNAAGYRMALSSGNVRD